MSIKALAAKKVLGLTSIAGVTSSGVLTKELITNNLRFDEEVKRGITHGQQDEIKELKDIITSLNKKVNNLEETKLKQETEIRILDEKNKVLGEDVKRKEKIIGEKDQLIGAYGRMVMDERTNTAKERHMREQDAKNFKETLKSWQTSMQYLSNS